MNKIVVSAAFAVSTILAGCAGTGGEGPVGYPSGSRGGSGAEDSAPARVHTAANEAPTRDATQGVHALRRDGDFVVCMQCRR